MRLTSEGILAQQAIQHFRAYHDILNHLKEQATSGNKTAQMYLDVISNPNQFLPRENPPVSTNNMPPSVGVSTLTGPPASANNQQRSTRLNYEAPKINLQMLLKQSWFKKWSTKDEYDESWTDAFVAELMASEWKDGIAQDWAIQGTRKKVNQIKGHVVGLLVDEGVLKGSYDSIASSVSITPKPRTFSRYMSEGKNQPYADWVKDYIMNHNYL